MAFSDSSSVATTLLGLILKAEAILILIASPLLFYSQYTPEETLGPVEYVATWTILRIALVAVVSLGGGLALDISRGLDAASSRVGEIPSV